MLLRARGKAVTAEDFEELTREVAPEVARVHCLTAAHESQAGLVRVLVVPHVSSDALDRVRREDLDPLPETVERIGRHLDQRRLVGTRVVVEPPAYQWVTVVVSLTALPGFPKDQVFNDVLRALNRLLHPLEGGPDGTGWPIAAPCRSTRSPPRWPGSRASTWPRRSTCGCFRRTRRRVNAGNRPTGFRWPATGWCTPIGIRCG